MNEPESLHQTHAICPSRTSAPPARDGSRNPAEAPMSHTGKHISSRRSRSPQPEGSARSFRRSHGRRPVSRSPRSGAVPLLAGGVVDHGDRPGRRRWADRDESDGRVSVDLDGAVAVVTGAASVQTVIGRCSPGVRGATENSTSVINGIALPSRIVRRSFWSSGTAGGMRVPLL